MKHAYQTEIAIGTQSVGLRVEYAYVAGSPEQGPSYASGGQPAEPPEVDVLTIEWRGRPEFQWLAIERGPLFNLIAQDEELYREICDAHDGEPA